MRPEAQGPEQLTAAVPLCAQAWLLVACMWNFRPHPSQAVDFFQLLVPWLLSFRLGGGGLAKANSSEKETPKNVAAHCWLSCRVTIHSTHFISMLNSQFKTNINTEYRGAAGCS